MKITFLGCQHEGDVSEGTKTMPGNTVMDLCPRCFAVQTVEDIFPSYPCGYRTKNGKALLAVVKEVRTDVVIACTSQFQPGSLNYQEWAVPKRAFHIKGNLLTADPFGVAT